MIAVGTQNEQIRNQWVEHILRHIPPGLRLLDAGAGEQKYKKYCSHLVYVSQDFAQYDGIGDGRGLQTGSWDQSRLDIISDIIDIPEAAQSFDVIMCTEVFEHLSDPILAIKEFARLLRPGGQLILTAPFCSLTHFAPFHYYTGFNRYFYERHLRDYGFEIKEINCNGNFFEYLAQELRRSFSVASQYTGLKTKWLEKHAINIVLRMLQRFSDNDSGSSEFLCFGYHILAQKY